MDPAAPNQGRGRRGRKTGDKTMFNISKIEPTRIGRMGLAAAAITLAIAGWSGEATAGFFGGGTKEPPAGYNGVSLNGIKSNGIKNNGLKPNGVETNGNHVSGDLAVSSVRLPNGTVLTIVAQQEQ